MSERTEPAPAVAVLHVTHDLDLATTPVLRSAIEEALASRPQTLAVDLSGCPFAGVDAIEMLAVLTAQARRQGTTLVLFGLRPIVHRAVRLLGLEDRLLYGQPPHPRRTTEVPR